SLPWTHLRRRSVTRFAARALPFQEVQELIISPPWPDPHFEHRTGAIQLVRPRDDESPYALRRCMPCGFVADPVDSVHQLPGIGPPLFGHIHVRTTARFPLPGLRSTKARDGGRNSFFVGIPEIGHHPLDAVRRALAPPFVESLVVRR